MFSDAKKGDKVWMAYGKTAGQGYHYTLHTIYQVSPKKKLITVCGKHFHCSDGSSTDPETSCHIEKATPELDELLRRKKYIFDVKTEFLQKDNLTYEQALAIHDILNPTEEI